ncbi:MAG: SGNH/GDSL hydrolase family protein [Myxococcota bacterium]
MSALLGCTERRRGDLEDAEIYAIGDSIMYWNLEDEASIPHVVGEQLDRPIYNAAIGGTEFLSSEEEEAIPEQYQEGGWSWLLVDGGGNDVNNRCVCGDCGDVLDQILSEDGERGAMADFTREVAASGVRVMIMGYYELPSGADFEFDGCQDELATLSDRQQRLADAVDGIWFADGREVVDGEDLSMFVDDLVHPSIEGSRVVGEQLAQRIAAAEEETETAAQ